MGASQATLTGAATRRAFDRAVRQILRVNYAGEYGAIRIYDAQIAIARRLHPAVAGFLADTVVHERRHAGAFRALMPARRTRPCAMTPLWGIGGTLLGFSTALMGTNAMMICTEAVERTVHAHLNEQLALLGGRDARNWRAPSSRSAMRSWAITTRHMRARLRLAPARGRWTQRWPG